MQQNSKSRQREFETGNQRARHVANLPAGHHFDEPAFSGMRAF
jgi:hypothetical protein